MTSGHEDRMPLPNSFANLPVDIFVLICRYLDVPSFIRLTSTCKSLKDNFVNEPSFWSSVTRETFRVPNRPVIENDGARWRNLYRRLNTATRAYTWGNNENNTLGHSETPAGGLRSSGDPVCWPKRMAHVRETGIVVDMQCGGWSTSVLNSSGDIFISGYVEGLEHYYSNQRRFPVQFRTDDATFGTLKYPEAYSSAQDTAVKQYSQGRAHILALSDSGRIWSWSSLCAPAVQIKLLETDGQQAVRRVVAGWDKSAVLIDGVGIIVWKPLNSARQSTDTALVVETASIVRRDIKTFVVLEQTIVFTTEGGAAYYSSITWDNEDHLMSEPQHIREGVVDVQGSFRQFALFLADGGVLISDQDALKRGEEFDSIPALQNTGVLAIAFGDYHFHALHASGHITAWGAEPQNKGALGLGNVAAEGALRGLRCPVTFPNPQRRHIVGFSIVGDAKLLPVTREHGRRVWFGAEKHDWLKQIWSTTNTGEARERALMTYRNNDNLARSEVSEWIEQRGDQWESEYVDAGEDGLPIYFALAVAAAGWHSGALVLVDRKGEAELTTAVRHQHSSQPTDWWTWTTDLGRWFLGLPTSHQSETQHQYVFSDEVFPRLRLSNGTEMPGEIPFSTYDR